MIRPLCPYRKPNNNNETPVTPCKRIKLTPLRDINTQPRMHFVSTLENANPQQQAPKTKSAPNAQVGPIHLRGSNPDPLKMLRTNLSTTAGSQILLPTSNPSTSFICLTGRKLNEEFEYILQELLHPVATLQKTTSPPNHHARAT